jgi:hypothetical protein
VLLVFLLDLLVVFPLVLGVVWFLHYPMFLHMQDHLE